MEESSHQDESPPQPHGEDASLPADQLERDRFDRNEVRAVLQRYPISEISTLREFRAGSRRSPKVRISASEGEFLLKRRAPRTNLEQRVRFGHAVIRHLQEHGHPVAKLMLQRVGNNTALQRGDQVYELFAWVDGRRCNHSSEEVRQVGEVLGRIHSTLASWSQPVESPHGTYHSADVVHSALGRIEHAIRSVDSTAPKREVAALVKALRANYEHASAAVEQAGWNTLPHQPIHGDWHPGNVVFVDAEGSGGAGQVGAVIDFDSSRSEPRVVDLANGLLHFAMRSKKGHNPAEWPPALSSRRLAALIKGWVATASPVTEAEAGVVPWLMVEAAIAESVVPVAETGGFSLVPGFPFLQMVRAKTEWIMPRAKAISALFTENDR